MKGLYTVTLSEEERQQLKHLISSGQAPARKIRRANILLKTDQSAGGPKWTYQAIADAFDVSEETISAIRRHYANGGLEAALNRKAPEREYAHRLDGHQEAQLIALACGEPPEGYAQWSLRLLANRMVELQYVEAVSHETVRQVLKKTNSNPG